MTITENVAKVLKNSIWDLAKCADNEPNVVPVAFKDITDDGKLVVGDVFLDTTLKNIAANGGKLPFPHTMQSLWKAIRSKELPSTSPAVPLLIPSKIW